MYNLQYLDRHDARNVSSKIYQTSGKRRVAIDVRVSTQHEMQIHALDNQEQWAIELASQHRNDWIFNPATDLYVEEGLSGTSLKKRPAFNEMIEKAKRGEYQLIVVREVCRFMRNARLTLNLVNELKEREVEVYFVNDGIWTFNQDDYFKLCIMAQYAEQESRKISERVFSGQATARANGILFGNGNILGYKHVKGKNSCDTTYEIDEEQAKTVRVIYDLCIKGYGIKKIKRYLVDNGYKTAEGNLNWHDSTIQRILRNSTYMGEVTHFQSVTEDPLTHERKKVDKEKHIRKKGNFPAIIDEKTWYDAQASIDERVNHDFKKGDSSTGINGIVKNKDIICRKMRCGCGRRFKKDEDLENNTATYRCYQVVEDGSQRERRERSLLLEDNCIVDGIRDWKIQFIIRETFKYLSFNIDEVKQRLLDRVEKSYEEETQMGYSQKDLLKLEKDIEKLEVRYDNLLDMREEGSIDKAEYDKRKKRIDEKMLEYLALKEKLLSMQFNEKSKKETLKAVSEFFDTNIVFPMQEGNTVPEDMIEAYVNSIKACANNIFEFDMCINPSEERVSPLVVPDDEYIPSVHPAKKVIDNSDATLLAEFTLEYDDAKTYANRIKRKAKKPQWPVVVKIYARL